MAKRLWCMVLLVWAAGAEAVGESEPSCPEDCDCHFFRINWVTDCSESNLTHVPDHGIAIDTYVLDLSGNSLTEFGPLPDGVKLRVLKLAQNSITQIKREVFAGLHHLIELDLSHNNIQEIELDAFADNHGLISVNLDGNPLEDVGGPLVEAKSVFYLSISHCGLDHLDKYIFAQLDGLNRLDLSGNPFKRLEDGPFDPLTSLQYLLLNDCSLETISEGAFIGLTILKELDLSDNPLRGPMDWVKALGLLERLAVARTGLSGLQPDVFANNTWLFGLKVAGNPLGDRFDLDESTLQRLQELDLSDCGLQGSLAATALPGATELKALVLSDNALNASDLTAVLRPLLGLKTIQIRNCTLSQLPRFPAEGSLRELDASYNPLEGAFTGSLAPLHSLKKLDLSHSGLQHIAESTFAQMTTLETLSLSGNPLKSLESGIFTNLTHLKVLDMSDCGLENVGVFDEDHKYPDLWELRLARNPLSMEVDFLPASLSGLVLLDLTGCNISTLPTDIFRHFSNLTTLYLGGNRLSDDSLDFLQHLPLLEELDLTSNNMTAISPFDLRFTLELKKLRLAGNPWNCGCHIPDMWEWALAVKSDLATLPGSTVSNDNQSSSKPPKKKKVLLCRFQAGLSPVMEMRYKRPWRKDDIVRSWARYVKEADCDSSRRLRPLPQQQQQQQPQPQALAATDPSEVWWLLLLPFAVLILSVAGIGSVHLCSSNRGTRTQ